MEAKINELIHRSDQERNLEKVKKLFKKGANINYRYSYENFPMFSVAIPWKRAMKKIKAIVETKLKSIILTVILFNSFPFCHAQALNNPVPTNGVMTILDAYKNHQIVAVNTD